MNDRKSSPVPEPAGPSLPIPANSPQRILVADDEPVLLQLNAEVLAGSGYEVDIAEDGAVAWSKLQRNRYDLLITDHDMPKLNGLELLARIHDAGVLLPAILVSGAMPAAELNQRPWLRLTDRLAKPYTLAELLGAVNKVLRPASPPKSARLFRECALVETEIPPMAKPVTSPLRNPVYPSQRILVVDDNRSARQLHVDLLRGNGYGVEGVQDGAAGWEALQTSDYDLVITDNTMPRMTGVEMIGKLRAARMTVPVIMATGALPTREFIRKPWLKPDVSLQKPFTDDDLVAAVKSLLGPDDGRDDQKESLIPKYL
jgi:DNA-binding response OmpR family regulator